MSKLEVLKKKVDDLYLSKNPERDEWADWLYENHIFAVAENAKKLSDRFGGNENLTVAAAILHDVADSVMARENPRHEKESILIAERLLEESGFSSSESEVILNDAIRCHSCRDGKSPKTLEGKIMATADAVAHLSTDFYNHAIKVNKKGWDNIRTWGLEKIDRDFYKKIFFDDVRKELEPYYKSLQRLFKA